MTSVSTGLTGGAVCIVIGALDVTSPLVAIDEYDSVVSGAVRPANARGLDSQALTDAFTTSWSVAVVLLGSTLLGTTVGEDAVLAVMLADLDDSRLVVDLLRGVVSSPLVSSVLCGESAAGLGGVGSVVAAEPSEMEVGFRPSAVPSLPGVAELVSAPPVLTTTPGGADLVARRVVEAALDPDSVLVLLPVDEPEDVCVDSGAPFEPDAPEAADGDDEFEVDSDDVDDEAAEPDSAEATPYPVTMAMPTPRATASPPTRPIYRAAPMAFLLDSRPTAANLSFVKPCATGYSGLCGPLLNFREGSMAFNCRANSSVAR